MFDTLNARQHFEAVIADIAEFYDEDRIALRDETKALLCKRKIIRGSTTELTDEQLKAFANKLSAFYLQEVETPPQFRRELNLETILFS